MSEKVGCGLLLYNKINNQSYIDNNNLPKRAGKSYFDEKS